VKKKRKRDKEKVGGRGQEERRSKEYVITRKIKSTALERCKLLHERRTKMSKGKKKKSKRRRDRRHK
jgi:hypothetical protein